jgi:heat shock protein HslJ
MTKYIGILLPLVVLAAGCATQPVPLTDLGGAPWVATTIQGAPPASGVPSTLQFIDQKQVSGNSGCNNYTGGVTISGDELRIGQVASTRKMCLPPLMGQENRFFVALPLVRRAKLEAGGLILLDDNGRAVMTLSRGR